MGMDLNQNGELKTGMDRPGNAAIHDLDWQRLRILRCTAQAMASSPGGLRFKAGTRPWLEGLSVGRSDLAVMNSRRRDALARPAAD